MTTNDYPTRTAVLLDTVHEHDHEHEHDINHEVAHDDFNRSAVSGTRDDDVEEETRRCIDVNTPPVPFRMKAISQVDLIPLISIDRTHRINPRQTRRPRRNDLESKQCSYPVVMPTIRRPIQY